MSATTSAAPPGRLVKAGTFELNVIEVGAGRPVLFVHGAGVGATGWNRSRQNVPAFAAGHRVLVVDLPGFGGSASAPAQLGTGPFMWAQAVGALIEALDLHDVAIVGNANGGNAALWTAIEHPDRVSALVLTAPFVGDLRATFGSTTVGVETLEALRTERTPAMMRAYLETLVYDHRLVTEELVHERLANVRTQALGAPRDGAVAAPLADCLTDVHARTLVTFGWNDLHIPVSVATALLDPIPDAELHVFKRCGHWVDLDRAADFESLALAFIDR